MKNLGHRQISGHGVGVLIGWATSTNIAFRFHPYPPKCPVLFGGEGEVGAIVGQVFWKALVAKRLPWLEASTRLRLILRL